MSTLNLGFYEDLTKVIFELSSNIIKYAPNFLLLIFQESSWALWLCRMLVSCVVGNIDDLVVDMAWLIFMNSLKTKYRKST